LKKKAKNFYSRAVAAVETCVENRIKVFCFFFSKKKALLLPLFNRLTRLEP